RRIERDADRNVIGIIEERAAQPGDTVVLTLDKEIQRVAAQALAAQIKWLNDPKNTREGEGREANAGAVAVIDLKNSALVAAVTYPSYNLETYSADYAKNAADPLYPFLNRAFSGIYAPGSCFKPTTAVAGLAAGVITPQSIVNCQRVYTFYPDYQPTCLSYHGNFTVVDALRHSCNVFFYDTGRQLSIEILNRTAHSLGLGVPTGIELSEATGIQSDPNTKNPGDVLQTAIGQLGNGYTPIQLANYTATLARNGERRRLTLIQSESSYYDWQKVLSKTVPAVEEVMDVPADIFQTVREGMVQASHDPRGTAYRYLGDYPIKVASKTGTPQTHEYPNSTFICYAPADDPQIAIAVVIEKGWHGYTGAPVARAILDAWFFPQGQGFEAQESQVSSPASTPVAAPQGH
ncbi:MAG: penicillin-binding transpeptidase domain-containing protein, partial [Oscillospiraceae bacterium]